MTNVKISITFSLAVFLFLVLQNPTRAVACDQLRYREFVGQAVGLKDSGILYTEKHEETACGSLPYKLVTRYIDQSGVSFARRVLEYGGQPTLWAPRYELTDDRFGRMEKVFVDGEQVVIQLREERNATVLEKRIPYSSDLVIDGGFDRYVRANLDGLRKGQSLRLRFVVPAQLDAYDFLIKPDRLPEGASVDTHLPLVLQIDNWLIAMFIDPIEVVYTLSPLAIESYEGVSNVRDVSGELQDAMLTYPVAPHQAAWKNIVGEGDYESSVETDRAAATKTRGTDEAQK